LTTQKPAPRQVSLLGIGPAIAQAEVGQVTFRVKGMLHGLARHRKKATSRLSPPAEARGIGRCCASVRGSKRVQQQGGSVRQDEQRTDPPK
jgi:hypothetical protein